MYALMRFSKRWMRPRVLERGGATIISVIIPVYNGEKYIEKAVNSVLAQTVADWELVIVNDGSTDGTRAILERCCARDARIHVHHQPNGGVSAARNAGIARASGAYLAFLDADDEWYPDCLETFQRALAAYPQAVMVGCAFDIVLQNGRRTDTTGYFQGKPEMLCLEDFLGAYADDTRAKCYHPISTCVRRELVQQVGGFRVGCRIGEDLALALIVAAYGPVVLCAHKVAVYNRCNSVATRDVSFDPDWYFFDEAKRLEADESIPAEKRRSLHRLMQWFQMRRVRHYLIDGERKKARDAYREIGRRPDMRKDLFLTHVLMLLPSSVVRRIFLVRWRGQA